MNDVKDELVESLLERKYDMEWGRVFRRGGLGIKKIDA